MLARAQLEVTADLSGEMPDEVTLLYSTSDKRLVDEPIAMREVDEGLRQYRGIITGENGRGILQNLTYRVVAGDATSPTYSVTVKQPPSASIDEVHYFDLRQSMQGGGGPACLRLRVVLTEAEADAIALGVRFDDALDAKLTAWVEKRYRDRLSPADLADPQLMLESQVALDELTTLLGLGSIYEFQL